MGYDRNDFRLTDPNKIPLVKPDVHFYQKDRRGMVADRIIQHPFLTITTGTRYECKPYTYLDVLTDGGINPQNNISTLTVGNSLCYLRFDDGYIHYINGEVYNLPVGEHTWFELVNNVGQYQAGQLPNETIESGYGNLILVLKRYPFIRKWKKNNPYDCLVQEIQPDDTIYFWYGIDMLAAPGITCRIPFLPKGFEYITIGFRCDTNCSWLMQPYCSDQYLGGHGASGASCNRYVNCCYRWSLRLMNTNTEEAESVRICMQWVNGVDNVG